MDKIITVRIETGGKGGRGVKSFLPIYPLLVFHFLLLVNINTHNRMEINL